MCNGDFFLTVEHEIIINFHKAFNINIILYNQYKIFFIKYCISIYLFVVFKLENNGIPLL